MTYITQCFGSHKEINYLLPVCASLEVLYVYMITQIKLPFGNNVSKFTLSDSGYRLPTAGY